MELSHLLPTPAALNCLGSADIQVPHCLWSLSIVIPAYNEENRLPTTLTTLKLYLKTHNLSFVEIVIVDDGSHDRTAEVVKQFSLTNPYVRLLENQTNHGKGYATRLGMREARGEWVLLTDADLSTPMEELDRLMAMILTTQADGAIGSRAVNRSMVRKRQSLFREFSGRLFNLAARFITGLPYRDTQCGFKLFRADVAHTLSARQQTEGFGFDVELLYIAKKHSFQILELPVQWFNVEGSKVKLSSGLCAFADLLSVRWHDIKGRYT